MKEKTPTLSLRDLLTIFFKHKYKIVFSFLPITIVTIYVALTLPTHYVAKSVIMVKPGREFAPVADVAISETRIPTINTETMINTEIQILSSHDLIARVVNEIGATNLYPELRTTGVSKQLAEKAAVDRFLQDLLAKPVKTSNAIEIYYRHPNPQMAARVLNTLVEFLKDKHLQIFGETKSPFIEEQLKVYENKLREAVERLQTFKDKNQISNLRDQYYFLIGKKTEIESALKLETSRLEEIKKKIAFLQSQKKKAVSDLYTASVGSKLVDLETKEMQLLATYKENSRPVIQIRKEIQKVKDALRQYEEELKESQEWTSLQADIGPQELKINNLKQQYIALEKQLAMLSLAGEELNKLERDAQVAQSTYETYLKKYEEARIAEEMDRKKITNIQIIETAAVPSIPVKTNQRKVLGVGFFLAVAVSFGLAYMAEYIPQGMTTVDSVTKYIRLPVLVAVSYKVPRG
ncbi:MAG: GumC family protein [Syntrophorhabdaceae bacterium]|nr:GumC family protein [Syntrophorhabdaceae bacterium]